MPTTEIVFEVDPAAGANGDVLLEYNGGMSDDDTLMYVDGVATTFTVEFSGNLPNKNNLADVNGFDLRGEEIFVVTDDTSGQRYYMLANSDTLFASNAEMYATMDAMPKGALAIANVDTTTDITICFVRGSEIDTPNGAVAIENLRVGDIVDTDTGPEAILWVGSRVLTRQDLLLSPSLRPIKITAGSLGKNCPTKDVTLSPNHRVILADWRMALNFGLESALCPAKHLVDGQSVTSELPDDGVEYFHILLASHRTVTSSGLQCETLFAGQQSLTAVSKASRAELLTLFPEKFQGGGHTLVEPELGRFEAAILA